MDRYVKKTNGYRSKQERYATRKAGAGKARGSFIVSARRIAPSTTFLENKFMDATKGDTAMAITWTSILPSGGVTGALSVPAQGDGESDRDGRVFTIKSVHIRGVISMIGVESATTPVPDQMYRLVLVMDSQTNATAITATDVMDAGSTNDVNSFRNLQNSKRFTVLWDSGLQRIIRDGQTNEGAVNLFAAQSPFIPWKFDKAFKEGIKVRCVGTDANITSVSDNSITLIGIATSTGVFIQYESRIRFTG